MFFIYFAVGSPWCIR